ncbi:MAG: apolipoprotein N-acyltransferase [Myxococcota bacterium]
MRAAEPTQAPRLATRLAATRARRGALALGCGALYAAAQPGAPFGSAWPLAFACGVPLVVALAGRGARERAVLGWLAGTAATCLSTVVPAAVSSTAYFGVSPWEALAIALTVGQVFGAGSMAAFAALAGPLEERSAAVAIARVAVAWTAAELLRSTLFTGLPWILLAHALTTAPALLQPAAWTGAAGLALLVAAVNGAFAVAALRGAAARRPAFAALAGVGACFAAAYLASGLADGGAGGAPRPGAVLASGTGGTGAVHVRLVQPNARAAARASSAGVGAELDRLVALTAAGGPVDLAVWPENALRAVLPANLGLLARAWPDRATRPRALLVGAPRSDAAEPGALFNSAFSLDDAFAVEAVHDKVHLLPLGEYVPAPLRALGVSGHDTRAGEAPRVLGARDGLRIGALVCYEIAFAPLARALAHDGADVLVNVANDGWFGRTGAVEQHFASAVLRAVETGRPVLRATHTGVTAAIDAWGRVVARAPEHAATALDADVVPGGPTTAFAATGDVAGPVACAFAFALALAPRRSSRC